MNTIPHFDQFTERARKVISLAQEEAQFFQHNSIGTEHLLLGLLREGEGTPARVLEALGMTLKRLRKASGPACRARASAGGVSLFNFQA